ncbi:hypothetical protein A6J71_00985 [Enterobacter cancerogenus]|uniref:hypothetical protein n=1 Tax=Enterobacter cancerogenus TaxID=69218 RepID=UPI000C9CEB5C|nr:hypothetical protein A6J71_00985 [Enterobacter cancerogenus]
MHDTYSHYLDAKNFPAGNATADPQQVRKRVFTLIAKAAKFRAKVSNSYSIARCRYREDDPTRQLHSLCTWCIRINIVPATAATIPEPAISIKQQPVSAPSLENATHAHGL